MFVGEWRLLSGDREQEGRVRYQQPADESERYGGGDRKIPEEAKRRDPFLRFDAAHARQKNHVAHAPRRPSRRRPRSRRRASAAAPAPPPGPPAPAAPSDSAETAEARDGRVPRQQLVSRNRCWRRGDGVEAVRLRRFAAAAAAAGAGARGGAARLTACSRAASPRKASSCSSACTRAAYALPSAA